MYIYTHMINHVSYYDDDDDDGDDVDDGLREFVQGHFILATGTSEGWRGAEAPAPLCGSPGNIRMLSRWPSFACKLRTRSPGGPFAPKGPEPSQRDRERHWGHSQVPNRNTKREPKGQEIYIYILKNSRSTAYTAVLLEVIMYNGWSFVHAYMCIYRCIYIAKEKERDMYTHIYYILVQIVYTCVHMCVWI